MYQAGVKASVLSSEISDIVEADTVIVVEGNMQIDVKVSQSCSTGVEGNGMVQDGIYLNLGDLLSSFKRKFKSTFGQARKGEDKRMAQQKSD